MALQQSCWSRSHPLTPPSWSRTTLQPSRKCLSAFPSSGIIHQALAQPMHAGPAQQPLAAPDLVGPSTGQIPTAQHLHESNGPYVPVQSSPSSL